MGGQFSSDTERDIGGLEHHGGTVGSNENRGREVRRCPTAARGGELRIHRRLARASHRSQHPPRVAGKDRRRRRTGAPAALARREVGEADNPHAAPGWELNRPRGVPSGGIEVLCRGSGGIGVGGCVSSWEDDLGEQELDGGGDRDCE